MMHEKVKFAMETYENACRTTQMTAQLCDAARSAVAQSRGLVDEVQVLVRKPQETDA